MIRESRKSCYGNHHSGLLMFLFLFFALPMEIQSVDPTKLLLDFGDMIFAPTINDLAITLSYALMNKSDLYSPLKNIILSYHNIFSITFDEFFSLMSLVKSRLTITVIMAAKQRKKFPNNPYLSISEKDAWSLLYKLDKINPYLFFVLSNIE